MDALLLFLQSEPLWGYSFVTVFALLVGSFLNVVIHRLPIMMERAWKIELAESLEKTPEPELSDTYNIATPASTCPACGHKIRWYENIPVVSYLLLRGACSQCKTSISLRYPFVEILSAASVLVIFSTFGFNYISLAGAVFTWVLICLIFIDLDTYLLPDKLTLPLLWLGLLVNMQDTFTSLNMAVMGAVIGYLSLWSIYWLFKLLTGKEGMGFGDFKLLAAIGAWVGADVLPVVIIMSSVVGAVIGITLMVTKRLENGQPIPFGPYLAIAGWISLLWGPNLMYAYLKSIGV